MNKIWSSKNPCTFYSAYVFSVGICVLNSFHFSLPLTSLLKRKKRTQHFFVGVSDITTFIKSDYPYVPLSFYI